MHRLVGQCSAAAHHSDISLLVNPSRHDSDFAFSRGNHPWAIWPNQTGLRNFQNFRDTHHIHRRYSLGDANRQRDLGVDGFQDRVRRIRWRDKNHRGVGARGAHCVCHGIEHRTLPLLGAPFARSDPSHHNGSVFNHLLGVKGSFAAGKSLHQNSGFFVDQNAHRAPPARFTTFRAPSFIPSAMVKFSPLSRRICCPRSTLVPSIRTTTGIFTDKSLAAATTPVASTSQRRMPPKILMKTARTAGSLSRMRNAFFTCSAEAPPPTSRKFAGDPPAYLMMSMVAIARPAPLTMQATLPSSLM